MLSLTNPKNGSESNHQQSSNLTRRQTKIRYSIKEVVIQYPLMSPALEDWILFPNEVVRSKNSSVRNPQNHPKSSLRPDKGLECPSLSAQTASTTKKKSSSQCLAHESQDRSRSLRTSDQLGSIKRPLDTATNDVGRNPPKMKAPRRLPTPDLSDVEEDVFWSCRSSADSSRPC